MLLEVGVDRGSPHAFSGEKRYVQEYKCSLSSHHRALSRAAERREMPLQAR